MSSVQRSIFFSAVERYASLLLFFVVTAVLSRMLAPKDFGIFAVISAITTVITASFQDFGGPNYLIQKHDASREAVRTAFTITLGISLLIGLVLFASASLISRFFGQDSLSGGIAVSALNFLLIPFSGTVSALFRRKMEFGKLAVCNVAANLIGATASITLAMLKFGSMALILGNVATNALLTIMLVAWHRDFGTFRPSLREYRDILGFGLYSGGVSVVNVFYNLAPQLFLARIMDFASVGLYSRALSITQVFDKLVMQVLNPVIMPAIVAQSKAGANLKRVYLEAMQLLAAVQWPFLSFIAITARPIIMIWLGESWLDIVPLVRLLCIANMALFAACLSYPVLVAGGRVKDALTSSLISLPPSLLLVLCAAFFGVQAVAASALLTLPFQAAVAIYFIGRHLTIRPIEIIQALLKSAVITAVSTSGAAACVALINAGMISTFLGLIAACCATAMCWWVGLALTGHPLLQQLSQAASGLALIAPRLLPSRPLP